MQLREMITTAGGLRANEDRVGHSGNLAWVIDGATDLYEDAALPAASDVQWLVDFVDGQLHEAGQSRFSGPAAGLLDTLAEQVCQRQIMHEFPTGRLPPACSIALLVDRGHGYEIARIGDATAVVTGHQVEVCATTFFDRRELAAVLAKHNGDSGAQVRAAMLQRREYTMIAGDDESVFSGHPRRRLRLHSINGSWAGVEQLLLCTDGFARLVTDYALYPGWREATAAAQADGLAHLEKLIREIERSPTADTHRRFKRSDDVAALLLTAD